MNGRQESNIAIENKTMTTIRDYPVIQDYYYSLSNSTARSKYAYCRYVRDYFSYLKESGVDVDDYNSYGLISMSDINKYLASQRMRYYTKKNGTQAEMSGAIRRVRFMAVKSFFEFLVNSEIIEKNPCDKVKAPKDTKQRTVVYMTEKEMDNTRFEIRNNIADRHDSELMATRNLLIFNLGCRTGLRESAIAEINVEDIDFVEKKITVTEKGNVTRDVWVGNDTISLINEWLGIRAKILGDSAKDCHALFISNRKKRISNISIYSIITEATKKLDKHITPHKMRSTCAVMIYEKTGDVYAAGDVLGHKNIQNTKKYTTVSQKKKASLANMLDAL